MIKILIVGYKHSGTTLLMQLLRNHPQVGWIEFEESYIEFDKPKEWVIMMAKKKVENLKKYAWGEKIPWGDRKEDIKAKRAITFTRKWLKFFKKDARVLHILRHPYDVASSGIPDGKIDQHTLKSIKRSLPDYIDFINKKENCGTVVYEDLVQNPVDCLRRILYFLNLRSDEKTINNIMISNLKFNKINSDRAYVFKRFNITPDIDYDELIRRVKVII